MRASMKFLTGSLIAALALSACGSSSSQNSSTAASNQPGTARPAVPASNALVRTAVSAKLGTTVLVNARGMTLYRLSGEQNGKFICSSAACLKMWHPLTANTSSTPSGTVSSLSTASRPGIGHQVTYKGMPLYTFAQDGAAGEVNGQGIKDVGVWNAVPAIPSPASAPAAPAPPAQPASSGGGASGY